MLFLCVGFGFVVVYFPFISSFCGSYLICLSGVISLTLIIRVDLKHE